MAVFVGGQAYEQSCSSAEQATNQNPHTPPHDVPFSFDVKYGFHEYLGLQLQVPLHIPPSWTAASLGLMAINMIWLFKLLRHAFERPRLRRRKKGKLT